MRKKEKRRERERERERESEKREEKKREEFLSGLTCVRNSFGKELHQQDELRGKEKGSDCYWTLATLSLYSQ